MAAVDTWDPAQYERFSAERSAPFMTCCRWSSPYPAAGWSTSAAAAGADSPAPPAPGGSRDPRPGQLAGHARAGGGLAGDGLRFQLGDIASFTDVDWDVVFSNAALHWLPDHEELFGRLAAALNPAGQLAVQMPANHDHPSHVVAAKVAGTEPFRTVLGGYRRESPVREPEWYALLLDRLGLVDQHVRLQVYLHHLANRDEVVEWVRGTLLTDYQARMPDDLFEEFLAAYRERLLPELEDTRPYRYPFKRLLLWGRRGSG